jgi:glutathione S-transferase
MALPLVSSVRARSNAVLTLYGVPPTRAIRPIWLLNELGLDCEIVSIFPFDEDSTRAIKAINPVGLVPYLVDGDIIVSESVAIMLHLAEAHGSGRFVPSNAAGRAAMNQWNFFLVTQIEQPLWRAGLHQEIYPERERNQSEIALAYRDCRRFLEPLEAHLDGREFLVGDEPTIADFNAAFTLDWAGSDDQLDASPNCRAFVERMYARPAAPVRIAEGFAYLNAGETAPRFRRDIERTDCR